MNDGTKIEVSFNNDVTNLNKLKQYEERLQNIYGFIRGLQDPKSNEAITKLEGTVKDMAPNLKKTTKEAKALDNTFRTMFKVGSLAVFTKAVEKLASKMMNLSQKSVEYIENVNLLEVAYKNANETMEQSSKRIEDYIDKMAEVYGLDESRLTRQFGIFKQLANAMQLPTETAEHLSEIMVKMTNDIASLYNLPLNRASNALQSALAGQVRPIRSATGADITEKTLQNTVADLGLDRTISELSYVEKRLVMVVSLTNQLKASQGDYARTIESASNQIRVMHEQWDRLARAFCNMFYPILEGILPYVNAILMALTEIFNLIASMLGFKMPEFDYSGLTGVSDLAMDIEDELGGAGDAVDKLAGKLKGLRSFDKLNVINTPKESAKGLSGGIGSGYVDPKIMDAFNTAFDKYNDMMDSVRMKAVKIKEDIMEWLGFTKEINPETGKIEWKYQGISKTFSNLYESFKNLSPLMKSTVGLIGILLGSKIVTTISKIVKSLGATGVAGQLKKIIGYMGVYKDTASGMLTGIDVWKKEATGAEKFSMALYGASGVIVGLGLVADGMNKISEEGLSLTGTLEVLGGTLSNVLGGAMIGASIGGGIGAIIGATAGAVASLIDAVLHYESASERAVRISKEYLADIKATGDDIKKSMLETEMEITSAMSMTNYHEKLLEELNQIVDENGVIKSGYEDRANFILNELSSAYGVEYKLVDGVVQNQEEFNKKIQEAIRLKEAEILLEAYKDDYIEALKQQKSLYADIEEAEKNRNGVLSEANRLQFTNNITAGEWLELDSKVRHGIKLTAEEQKKYNSNLGIMKVSLGDTIKQYRNYDDAVDEATKNYTTNANTIARYSDFQTAVETGNLEEIDEARDKYTRTFIKDGEEITQSEESEFKERELIRKNDLDRWRENNDERYESYKQSLTDMKNYTDGVTPEIVAQWSALGRSSTEDFITEFSKLDEDMQKEIIDKMYENGHEITDELQRGLNSADISKSIKITVDDYVAKQRLNQIHSKFANAFGFLGVSIPPLELAGGGLPQVGQVFIANEKGPELVDQIGGQTFVANQKQIGEYMDERYGKYSQPVNVTIPVSVGGEQLGTIVLNNLQELAKTNGSAITIGG